MSMSHLALHTLLPTTGTTSTNFMPDRPLAKQFRPHMIFTGTHGRQYYFVLQRFTKHNRRKSQSWAFATFSSIRYSLFRYFNTSFRYPYRYSATFPKIAIRYSLFAIATFVSSVLRTASILGLYLR
jgi:hypothetical protein